MKDSFSSLGGTFWYQIHWKACSQYQLDAVAEKILEVLTLVKQPRNNLCSFEYGRLQHYVLMLQI